METLITNPSLYFLGFLFLTLSSFLIKRLRWYISPLMFIGTVLSYLLLTPSGANFLYDQVATVKPGDDCAHPLALMKTNALERMPRNGHDFAALGHSTYGELLTAFHWLQEDEGRLLLISGSESTPGRDYESDAALVYNYLLDAGIGRDRMVFNGTTARSPYETALAIKNLVDEREVTMIGSALNLAREKATHEHLGFSVCPVVSDNPRIRSWSVFKFLPSGQAVTLAEQSLYELIGSVWYKLTDKA